MAVRKRLTSGLAQFALIVVGVLVALAAESAWSERSERARERLYLEQLRADSRRNAESLEEAIGQELGYASRAREAMGYVLDRDSVDSDLLVDALNLRRSAFVPTTSTLRALVLYGDVGLVQDPAVRAAVMGAADVFETHMSDMRVLDASAMDTLRRLMDLRWRHSAADVDGILDDTATGPTLQMTDIYNRNRAQLLIRMRDANAELLRLLEGR